MEWCNFKKSLFFNPQGIFDSGKVHQWMLKPLNEKLLRKGMLACLQTVSPQITYKSLNFTFAMEKSGGWF